MSHPNSHPNLHPNFYLYADWFLSVYLWFLGVLDVVLSCHIRVNVAGQMTVALWCQCW
jgi:hypothetical protein